MAEDIKDKEEASGKETQIYELGYHLLSSILEEDVPAEVDKIKTIILRHGNIIFGEEEMARLVNLAYPIDKKIDNKKRVFETAYFGFIKFETTPEEILLVDEEIKALENILRFLVIKTVRSAKTIPRKGLLKRDDKVKGKKTPKTATLEKQKTDTAGKLSKEGEKEVDEAIEGLVIE